MPAYGCIRQGRWAAVAERQALTSTTPMVRQLSRATLTPSWFDSDWGEGSCCRRHNGSMSNSPCGTVTSHLSRVSAFQLRDGTRAISLEMTFYPGRRDHCGRPRYDVTVRPVVMAYAVPACRLSQASNSVMLGGKHGRAVSLVLTSLIHAPSQAAKPPDACDFAIVHRCLRRRRSEAPRRL